jgi:transposase InsO family protein
MAIVEGLRWCRYFTYGKKVVVHTDHRPLLHLMQKKETHVNLARWLIELQQYDNVTIQHVDGKRNTVADALSRWEELTQGRPVRELQDEVQGAFGLDTDGDRQVEEDACNTVWVMRGKTVKDYQTEDKVLSQAIKAIQDKVDPTTIGDAELKWYVERCELNEKGTLVLKEHGEQQGRKVIVPKAFQRLVFDQFHGSKVGGGHTNARTTQEKMREFAWRGMPRDVAEWHKRCYQCQIRAPKRMKVPPVMTRLQRPFEKMGLDVCGPLHATQAGMLHYLTCIDEFTKYVVTVAIPDTKCLTIARALWEQVILKYGCPQEITTDNAKTFSADLFKWMMEQMGIKHVFCTPHHSDGNAITERSFRTYHDMIAKYAETWEPQEEKKEWDRMLPIATFAYNVTRHSTTEETPYMLMHGRDPIFPIHLTLQEDSKPRETMSIKDFRAELVKMVELVQKQALEAFDKAADRIKAQADKHCKELDISEGELVLYRDYSLRVGMSTKFKNPWKDVYRVRKLVNQHAWIVPSTSPNETLKKVHLNQIKRFYPDLEEGEEQTHEEAVDRPQVQRKVTKTGSGWREKKQERKKEYERQVEAKAQAEEKVQKRRGEGTKYNLRQNVRRKDAAEASS